MNKKKALACKFEKFTSQRNASAQKVLFTKKKALTSYHKKKALPSYEEKKGSGMKNVLLKKIKVRGMHQRFKNFGQKKGIYQQHAQ